MSIDLTKEVFHGNLAEDSLIFCQLPKRMSGTGSEEQPRLSYYNGNELQAVPFRWEASPGKPMVDNQVSGDTNMGYRAPPQLRPPPGASAGAGGFRSKRGSFELAREELDHSNSFDSRSGVLAGTRLNPPPSQQKSRLPPKNKNSVLPIPPYSYNARSSSAVHPTSPGHRRGTLSDESFASCGRSDFDWPEVSDDEEYGTPPQEHKASSSSSSRSPTSSRLGGGCVGGGVGHTKEELSFSSSRSSFSSSSTVSSPNNSGGGSRGGSAREIMLWRNIVNMAAAQAVGAQAALHAGAVPCKPVYRGESNSEEDDAEDDEKVPPMGRGFFACMGLRNNVQQTRGPRGQKEMVIVEGIEYRRNFRDGIYGNSDAICAGWRSERWSALIYSLLSSIDASWLITNRWTVDPLYSEYSDMRSYFFSSIKDFDTVRSHWAYA